VIHGLGTATLYPKLLELHFIEGFIGTRWIWLS